MLRKLLFLPFKLAGGCLVVLLILAVIIAVAAYFIYQWVT
jgi:hypothetical protein